MIKKTAKEGNHKRLKDSGPGLSKMVFFKKASSAAAEIGGRGRTHKKKGLDG